MEKINHYMSKLSLKTLNIIPVAFHCCSHPNIIISANDDRYVPSMRASCILIENNYNGGEKFARWATSKLREKYMNGHMDIDRLKKNDDINEICKDYFYSKYIPIFRSIKLKKLSETDIIFSFVQE